MSKRSTTEETTTPQPMPEWIRRTKVLPEKVATLRHKLYQKAKHEPKFRFYSSLRGQRRSPRSPAPWTRLVGPAILRS